MNDIKNKVVLIVGLGMIGGSIARGLKKANPKRRIIACDTDAQALQQARGRRCRFPEWRVGSSMSAGRYNYSCRAATDRL